MKSKLFLLILVAAALMTSCNTQKDIPYMIGANELPPEVLQSAAKANDPVVMPGDMLQINVISRNAEAVKPFNKIDYVSKLGGNTNINNNNENSMYYYLVDANGNIEYPYLGTLHIGGMSKSAVENHIASLIYPRYLTERPGVEVRFQNFRVYILGEVKNPGEIKATNGRLNLLEAIAMAGDLTIQGRRDNVMIVRTNSDGSRSIQTVNMNDKNMIISPSFNLQQNDIIYVEPNSSKARSSWNVPPALSLGMSSVGTLISIATLIITLTK
ncbi:MAG: polysaccharide biosynthesis/export family protein [Muribaculaceae bacterium]|nr:polysaccharide biosynthesis/export family protein [Muribaculaceae bacterium]